MPTTPPAVYFTVQLSQVPTTALLSASLAAGGATTADLLLRGLNCYLGISGSSLSQLILLRAATSGIVTTALPSGGQNASICGASSPHRRALQQGASPSVGASPSTAVSYDNSSVAFQVNAFAPDPNPVNVTNMAAWNDAVYNETLRIFNLLAAATANGTQTYNSGAALPLQLASFFNNVNALPTTAIAVGTPTSTIPSATSSITPAHTVSPASTYVAAAAAATTPVPVIVGSVFGVLIFVMLLCICCCCLYILNRRRRSPRKNNEKHVVTSIYDAGGSKASGSAGPSRFSEADEPTAGSGSNALSAPSRLVASMTHRIDRFADTWLGGDDYADAGPSAVEDTYDPYGKPSAAGDMGGDVIVERVNPMVPRAIRGSQPQGRMGGGARAASMSSGGSVDGGRVSPLDGLAGYAAPGSRGGAAPRAAGGRTSGARTPAGPTPPGGSRAASRGPSRRPSASDLRGAAAYGGAPAAPIRRKVARDDDDDDDDDDGGAQRGGGGGGRGSYYSGTATPAVAPSRGEPTLSQGQLQRLVASHAAPVMLRPDLGAPGGADVAAREPPPAAAPAAPATSHPSLLAAASAAALAAQRAAPAPSMAGVALIVSRSHAHAAVPAGTAAPAATAGTAADQAAQGVSLPPAEVASDSL